MEATLSGMTLPFVFRPEKPMTDEEFMAFSGLNEIYRMEREPDGSILVMSPTGSEGSRQNTELVLELGIWNRLAGHGIVLESNAGITLPDSSVRSADAAWIDGTRWHAIPTEKRVGYAEITPDFIVELRSASDSLPQLRRKMEMWMCNGVQLGWLIDPLEKAVTIYRPGQPPERMDNVSQVAGEGPIAGFVLPLDRIFA